MNGLEIFEENSWTAFIWNSYNIISKHGTCNNDLQFTVTLFILFAVSGIRNDGLPFELFLNGCVSACHSFQNVEWDFAVLRIGFLFVVQEKRDGFFFVNGVTADDQKPRNQGPGEVVLYDLRINSAIYLFSSAQIFTPTPPLPLFHSFFIVPACFSVNNTIIM